MRAYVVVFLHCRWAFVCVVLFNIDNVTQYNVFLVDKAFVVTGSSVACIEVWEIIALAISEVFFFFASCFSECRRALSR